MRRSYIRIALLVSVPHWVIARVLPIYDWGAAREQAVRAAAFSRVYGR